MVHIPSLHHPSSSTSTLPILKSTRSENIIESHGIYRDVLNKIVVPLARNSSLHNKIYDQNNYVGVLLVLGRY